ncbi:TPA: hypothetical protein ACQ7WR_002121 [Escherichia coli]|uniref:hypothetical protein n=1 Tax=Escherichia coli TaxID=562 RepID=UPI001D0CACA2|nr:hypothetical protein [Escherichia coli]EMD4022578.1 hypothetical protein [Escherichia coli]
MTLTKEWLQQTISELEEERDAVPGVVNEDAAMALAAMKLALVSLEAKDKIPELRQVIYHFRDWNEGFPIERFKADYVISWMLANYPPAQPTAVSVPDGYRLQPISEYDAMCAAMLQGAEPVTTLKPAIFIDGNISPDDADKLAETISNLNSEHREPQQEVK